MATATGTYAVGNLQELEGRESDGRISIDLGRHFDIRAFGIGGRRAVEGGKELVSEHDELGFRIGLSGQEELYIVTAGRATFTVNGEDVDAPAGSLVFVRDPAAKRKAVAEEAGTTLIAIGGKAGEAFLPLTEDFQQAYDAYAAGDHERALELYHELLAGDFPRKAGILYNIACIEVLIGRADDAVEHLRGAIEADPAAAELAREDTDLDSIRDDPRFAELVG